MRLLIDAHCFDHVSPEGVNTYLKGIYTAMPPMAPDVEFFFVSLQGDALAEVFGKAPNIHYLKLRHHSRPLRLLADYRNLVSDHRIDVAHFQYFAPPLGNCRTVVTLHDILFEDFPQNFPAAYRLPRRLLFRHAARRADILATVSDYSRRRIAERYRIPAEDIVVTPNAVAPAFFNIDKEKARRDIYARGIRPFILNVGRIEPRKNQLALLQAYHRLGLADRGYDLVLINRRSIPVPELEHFHNALPEETRQHIHRIDGLPHEQLPQWYAAASLFVFPSLGEGFGIPPLEAAAAGTPVVCNNATALADFSFLGPNLADLTDPQTLDSLILSNLSDPDHQFSTADFPSKYSWAASASTLLSALRNL